MEGGGWGDAFSRCEPIDDGIDLLFGEGAAFLFGKGWHEGAGFTVGDPVTPAFGVRQGPEHAEIGDHFGAMFGEVAYRAHGLEQFASHFSFCWGGVAAGAVTAEHGLAVGGGNLHVAQAVGIGFVTDDDVGSHGEAFVALVGIEEELLGDGLAFAADIHTHGEGAGLIGGDSPGELGELGCGTAAAGLDLGESDGFGGGVGEAKGEQGVGGAGFSLGFEEVAVKYQGERFGRSGCGCGGCGGAADGRGGAHDGAAGERPERGGGARGWRSGILDVGRQGRGSGFCWLGLG